MSQTTPSETRKAFSYSALDLALPAGIAVAGGDSGGPALINEGATLSTLGVLKGEYAPSPQWLKYEDLRHHHEWLTQAAAELGSRF